MGLSGYLNKTWISGIISPYDKEAIVTDFPKGFLWGAATSSHQVEGGNSNNDWWDWEVRGKLKEPSGKACNHYELFDQDFKLAKSLNHNAHRFSIEWSRIQPEEGSWDQSAIDHYKNVVASLKKKNIEPVVTLHHFTNPKWFMDKGGWLRKDSSGLFAEYTKKMAEALGKDVKYWITINEPLIYINGSYITGIWPPGEKSLLKSAVVFKNMVKAHKKSYDAIRAASKGALISIAKAIRPCMPCEYGLKALNRLSSFIRNFFLNDLFMMLIKDEHLDFIGLNYYTVDHVKFGGIFGRDCHEPHHKKEWTNFLKWEICPEGFFTLLMELKKYNLPIFITENGTCQTEDLEHWRFIQEHLKQLKKAMDKGVPVIGYLYWSLLDNFEWHEGFDPRFGIVHVDYKTLKRTPKESARFYAEVCKTGTII